LAATVVVVFGVSPPTMEVVVVAVLPLVVTVVGAAVVLSLVVNGLARTRNGRSTATDTTVAAR
jgi:hypothetical protein